MATKIKGEDLILYVHDDVAYRPLACLTQNSLSETTNIIESQTKCDPGVVTRDFGTSSYEISCEGEYIDTTSVTGDTSSASHDYLRTIQRQKVTWRMDTGLTDTPYYYGVGIISELSLEAPAGDELSTFSATITGDGAIVTVDPITP
jgi:hypothetical protein